MRNSPGFGKGISGMAALIHVYPRVDVGMVAF